MFFVFIERRKNTVSATKLHNKFMAIDPENMKDENL